MRIAVVAPSSRFKNRAQVDGVAARVQTIAEDFPDVELVFHDQCRLPPPPQRMHFAGTDREREDALVAVANDPDFHAVWFARGGYGSNRIAERALARFEPAARGKAWLGYSDAGFLLAALHRDGYERVAHGPMPKDLLNADGGGDAAVRRALAWLAGGSAASLEGHVRAGEQYAAFNIMVLSMLLGSALEPNLAGHVLMLEDVSEKLYATDRAIYHITASDNVRRVAGIRLGRVAFEDNPGQPFGETAVQIVERWCEERNIPYLGRADIGHDSANKVVPFGRFAPL